MVKHPVQCWAEATACIEKPKDALDAWQLQASCQCSCLEPSPEPTLAKRALRAERGLPADQGGKRKEVLEVAADSPKPELMQVGHTNESRTFMPAIEYGV